MLSFNLFKITPEIGVIICLFLGWVFIFSRTVINKIAMSTIRKMIVPNTIKIKGHEIEYWLRKVSIDIEFSFDISEEKIIMVDNIEVFLVKGQSSVIDFGRFGFGTHMTKYKCLFLVVIGGSEMQEFDKNLEIFVKISSQNNTVAVYLIRKLLKFSRLVKNRSGKGVILGHTDKQD